MSLENSDGSAEWIQEHGSGYFVQVTRIISSVNGPLEVKSRDELPTKASIELVVRPVVGLPTIREGLIQDKVHGCLESVILRETMPRSLLQIVVQVLEAGEPAKYFVHELAGAINASGLALVNAGVPLSGIIGAVTLAIVNGEQVVNPGEQELAESTSTHVVAYKFSNGPENPTQKLVFCESNGIFTEHELLQTLAVAKDNALDVYSQLRKLIAAGVADSLKFDV